MRTSPCTHAAPNTPTDHWTFFGRLLPRERGGLPQIPEGSASAAILSGPAQASLALRTCVLAQPPCRGLLSQGFKNHGRLGTVTSPDSYRGASTIPRAGLAPAGEVHLHGAQENQSGAARASSHRNGPSRCFVALADPAQCSLCHLASRVIEKNWGQIPNSSVRFRTGYGVIGVRHQFRCGASHRALRASRRLGEFGL